MVAKLLRGAKPGDIPRRAADNLSTQDAIMALLGTLSATIAAAVTAVLFVAPLAAEAQQAATVHRIGVLYPGGSAPLSPRMEAFRKGLRESGYVEGKDISIEIRYADGKADHLAKIAAELVERGVRVITTSGDLATRAAQRATASIPIVAFTDDLVGAGLVASYARPGGNITGISILSSELNAKRLEILKEVSPGNSRVAVLWDPAAGTAQLKAMEVASRSLGVRLLVLEVRGPADLDGAFKIANKEGAGAVNVLASPLLASYSEKIVALAAESRLPAIYQWREHAEAGGLMSYGPILLETWRQTGHIVGKVLRGAKPADLPVELPTNFELVINAKTAKTLGLTIPPSLLSRAHRVIQ
jgi:putative tryptophan/tyrosine transport system substrate-binding protein